MATKKKSKKVVSKKSAKATKSSSKKVSKKTAAKKSAAPKKRLTTKPASKPTKQSASSLARKASKTRLPARRGKQENIETVTFEPKGLGPRSGGQSGDLQGLSNRAGADSESVDELLEEGNAFEAEVVKGVEDVPDADEGEVRTRQFPVDDVPTEYDDEEQQDR
ncbi:MAG TPA: hypothetical protein VE545_03190 [Candidatus Dormibacteraeota bacterium]|nr:hypothetical protein [Candidatus Dormibacteraeota bacterium]